MFVKRTPNVRMEGTQLSKFGRILTSCYRHFKDFRSLISAELNYTMSFNESCASIEMCLPYVKCEAFIPDNAYFYSPKSF